MTLSETAKEVLHIGCQLEAGNISSLEAQQQAEILIELFDLYNKQL